MSRFKTIASLANLIITTCDSSTAIVTNLGSAAVHASKSLDILAEDMEASVISSTELNALEREAEYQAAKLKYALPA